MSTVTLVVPDSASQYVEIDGVQYPVVAGTVTVPRRYYAMLLNNGYLDGSESPLGVWDDIQGDISQGVGTAALAYDAFRDTPWSLYCFQHNQTDSLFFRFQMPHSWNLGNVRPHLHFTPLVNPATPQVFAVRGHYAWAQVGDAIPALAGWTAYAAQATIDVADAFTERILPLVEAAPPASARPSAVLLLSVIRDAGGADTFTTNKAGATIQANIGLLSADVHYQKARQGTATEFA